MTSKSSEYQAFDSAIGRILHADPKAVKEAIEKGSREQAKERAAKGEGKRGRKPSNKRRRMKTSRSPRLQLSELSNQYWRFGRSALAESLVKPSGIS